MALQGNLASFLGDSAKNPQLEIITDLKPTVPENPQALKSTEAETLLPGSGLLECIKRTIPPKAHFTVSQPLAVNVISAWFVYFPGLEQFLQARL